MARKAIHARRHQQIGANSWVNAGVPDDATLRVYSIDGELLATAQGTQIDVNHLPNGTYLLQIGTQVMRFIKE